MTLDHQQLDQASQHRLIFWHRVRGRAVLDIVPSNGLLTVADVGAGGGSLGWILREARPDTTYRFFEPSPELADALRTEFGAEQELTALSQIATADLVAVLDVAEHIEDDSAFLTELVSSMRPGATLVLTVPALQWLWSEWDVKLGHHRRYSREQLRALTAGLPLLVDEITFLFPELVPPGIYRRFRKSRVATEEATEFPVLPDRIDHLLEQVGTVSYRARRFVPLGTSLLLRATRVNGSEH